MSAAFMISFAAVSLRVFSESRLLLCFLSAAVARGVLLVAVGGPLLGVAVPRVGPVPALFAKVLVLDNYPPVPETALALWPVLAVQALFLARAFLGLRLRDLERGERLRDLDTLLDS